MSNIRPVISVIMPCYNEEKTVESAVNSILNQTFQDFEFIIIDDCSQDNTSQILQVLSKQSSKIKVLRNSQNLGYSGSINKGIKAAGGDFIARMDADDFSFPERFEKQVTFLLKHPEIGLVGTGVELVMKENKESRGTIIMPETHDEILKGRYLRSFNFHPTIMAKKTLFVDYKGYDESIKRAEELDLWLRASVSYKFHNLPDILLRYSVNEPGKNKISYWYFGFKVRLLNMIRRREFLLNGHTLFIYTIKFFAGKFLGLKPKYLKHKTTAQK